jgi:hypothetical protein
MRLMKPSRKGSEIRTKWLYIAVFLFVWWLSPSLLSVTTHSAPSTMPSRLTAHRTPQKIIQTPHPWSITVAVHDTNHTAVTQEHRVVETEKVLQTISSTVMQPRSLEKNKVTRMGCRKSAAGLVIVVTRSVVTPPRRPARLAAIAKSWAPEMKARGGEVIVLVAADPNLECGSTVLHVGTTALPFTCVAPPRPLDLSTDKAKVFEWIVGVLLIRGNSGADNGNSDANGLPRPTGGPPVPLKYLLWCNDHTFVVPGALVAYLAALPSTPNGVGAHRRPLFAGKELESGGRRFNSGAAGILLSTRCVLLAWHSGIPESHHKELVVGLVFRSLEILVTQWSRPLEFRECLPPHLQPKKAAPLRKVVKRQGFVTAACGNCYACLHKYKIVTGER